MLMSENMEMQKYLDGKSQQKQKLLEEPSPRNSESKSSKSSRRKTPGKPPLNMPRGKDKQLRADIISRLGLSSEEFKKIPNIDPFVNKMIMNEIIPSEVKKTTKKADETFGKLLNVARSTKNVDYEDGVYFVQPKDPRGI